MKSTIAMAIVAMMIGNPLAHAAEKPAPEQQVMVRVSVFEGDPLGSRKAGTIGLLAEPVITTLVGQKATYLAGGQLPVGPKDKPEYVPYGIQIEFQVDEIRDGKASLDLTFKKTEKPDADKVPLQFQSESIRVVSSKMPLGEAMKFRCGKGTADKQLWVEVTVKEVHAYKSEDLIPPKTTGIAEPKPKEQVKD